MTSFISIRKAPSAYKAISEDGDASRYYSGIEQIDLDMLHIDENYQTTLSESRIKRMVAGWDKNLVNRLVVNRRESGKLFIIDGQHRVAAARKLNIVALECDIYRFPTIAMEADYFHKFNTTRRPIVSKYDQYKALLTAGNPEIVGIENILRSKGLGVCKVQVITPNTIAAINNLMWIYSYYGADLLEQTLSTIMHVFDKDMYRWSDPLLSSFAAFINEYSDFNKDRLRSALAEDFSPRILISHIKDYHRGYLGYQKGSWQKGSGRKAGSDVLKREYNKPSLDRINGRRGRLI
tara:strand:+ start:1545 stop:2423 length:879 start_codon:yes stop_codon:yes gene_type:complete